MAAEADFLLFYDTFSHEAAEDQLRVDMVKFTLPVNLSEVRIVPKNCPAHANLSAMDKLGKTTPTNFKLDIFSNDSSNPLAPTFNPLGTIDFKDDCLLLPIVSKASCDVVVVRGYYSILSICLYGTPTAPRVYPVPPSFPQTQSRSPSPYNERSNEEGFRRKRAHSPEGGGASDRGGSPRVKAKEESKEWSSLLDFFEPFSPDHSPEHSFDLYDDEIPPAKRSATTDAGYEEFSDEEIAFAEEEFEIQEAVEFDNYNEDSQDTWLSTSISFNPYHTELNNLESFPSLYDTPHEALINRKTKVDTAGKRPHSDEGTRIREQIMKLKESEVSFKWADSIDDLIHQLYPGLAQFSLRSEDDGRELLKCVCDWVSFCLDDDNIGSYSPPLNVRVLKTGLRLGEGVAALSEEASSILLQLGVMKRLCDFICQSSSFMPSSIKLTCIRVLSILLDYPSAMESFLGWDETGSHDSQVTDEEKQTPYRRILEVVLSNQASRVQVASSRLLHKAHLYEILTSLKNAVDQVVSATPIANESGVTEDFWSIKDKGSSESEEKMEEDGEREEEKEEDLTMEAKPIEEDPSLKSQSLPADLVKTVVELLTKSHQMLEESETNLALHSPKSFPIKSTSIDRPAQDVFVGVARMLKQKRFLECLLVLLTAPSLAQETSVFSSVRSHIISLLITFNGLLFFSSNPRVTNAIIKVLTQSMENEVPLDALQPLTDFLQSDSSDSCTPFNLGMLLVHHLQVLQSLDALRQAPKQTMTDLESSESLSSLHTLFSMTLFPIGKCAVSHILSLGGNISVLLPFMEPRGYKDHDTKLSRSSISSRYAAVLILKLLQSSSNLSCDFLTPHSRRLLAMSEFFKDNQSLTMSALYSWLHPLKHLGEPAPTASLMGVVKENISQVNYNKPTQGSAAIITCLRLILVRCTSNPHMNALEKETYTLQQREAIVALFSCGSVEILTNLLQKVSDLLVPLWSQKQSIGNNNAIVLDILISLSLRLLRLLLVELMDDGTFQFRDTRVLQALFSLHTVACSAPHSGIFQSSAHETEGLIVDCLATFTRPETVIDEKETNPTPDNSCWCLLLSELINYTVSKPQANLSGLMLLSSLLPLPLPLQSSEPISSSTIERIVCLRHLWASHLLPLSSSISSLIEALLPSMCLALQNVLRRTCAQLMDLVPSLALSITKSICSLILVKIDSQDDEGGKEVEVATTEKKETLSPLVMTLTLCAVLISQPMFKVSLLSLICSNKEGGEGGEEEEEGEGYSRFIPLLLFLVQKKETVVPAKLCVMTILQSLLNVYVTLAEPVKENAKIPMQQLANSLPSLSQLEHIISAVLTHLGSPDQPLSTIAIGLKIVSAACQHMTGLTILHNLLPTSIKRFMALLKRLIAAIKNSAPPSAEALQCVSLFLDTLSDLAAPDSTLSLSIPLPLLKCAVWEEDEKGDLLQDLLSAVKEAYKDEEDEQNLADDFTASITEMSEQLANLTPDNSVPSLPTLELPGMECIEKQFLSRPSVTDVEISSSPEFWLATPPHDETELEPETVTANLEEIAKETCSGFNLQEELKKQFLPSPPSSPTKHERKKKIIISGPEAQRRLKEAIQQRRVMGRGRDLFRARKQNTSRPPSMHVDDFMTNSRVSGGLQRGSMVRGGMSRGLMRGREGIGLGGGYIMPPPLLPLGGRWMTPGLTYSRRDMPVPSWESRTQQFLASVNRPEPMRSVWSHVMQQESYNRARGARMVEMMNYSRPSSHGRLPSRLPSSSSSSRRN